MTGLNQEISNSGLGFRMITLVFAILDPATKTVCIANAGHLPPVRRHADGTVELIGMRESGLPLGVLPDHQYFDMQVTLKPGESLVFYTDGITEAMDQKDQMYANSRLLASVKSSKSGIKSLVTELVNSVQSFCGSAAQRDDICVTALRCIS
jgi:sigma-B regulation protein RsbU (phosphoserine phosphatase)